MVPPILEGLESDSLDHPARDVLLDGGLQLVQDGFQNFLYSDFVRVFPGQREVGRRHKRVEPGEWRPGPGRARER